MAAARIFIAFLSLVLGADMLALADDKLVVELDTTVVDENIADLDDGVRGDLLAIISDDEDTPDIDSLFAQLQDLWNMQHADLQENAQNMKDKEQSVANKILGGVAIGAAGIGGMNLMSAMAEQQSDAAAESDMRAYLATFACDYGAGRNIKGGQTNIEVPGGNDLIFIVTEYRALAADLKIRKDALGKSPGIEAEVLFDIADTGLYDNVGTGRQSGAYTSLSVALTDENSQSASDWQQQVADSQHQVNTGVATVGVAAVGSAAANMAINGGNTEQSAHINQEYQTKRQELAQP